MTKLEDVKKAYIKHNRCRSQSAVERPMTEALVADTIGDSQP
jgi:hypothetical protein